MDYFTVRRSMPRSLFLFFAILLLSGGNLSAQTRASAFLPEGHWSLAAVDRLHALGLVPPGTGRGQQARTIAEVRAVLDSAAMAGGRLARGWQRRFEREFGDATLLTHASLAGGAGVREDDVAPGLYTTWGEENWTGARPLEDRTSAEGRVTALGGARVFAAGLDAEHGAARSRINELYGTARFGWLGAWGGRRTHGFGTGTSGIVLNRRAPFDGGGVFLAEPLRLPWILRHLGPVRVEFAAGVVDANGPVERPWFVLTRGSFEPHPRFGVGVTRGGMIGPDEGARGVADVLFFLIGGQTGGSEYDNQVVAVDGWLRANAGPVPLVLYLEWGAEDAAGAWWDVPGLLAGIEVPAIPGLPWMALTVERTTFTRSRSGNPPWYRHPIGFHEGWTSRGEILGHPLGGHGRELLARASATLLDGSVEIDGRAFTRVRGSENLFAPERMGRSNGGSLAIDAELARGFVLHAEGLIEEGSDWRRAIASGAVRIYLPR